MHERSRAHKAEIASRVSRTYSTLHLLQAADEREYMLLLSVPSLTCFTATSHGSSVGIGQHRVMIRMQADFDPFTSPRGPPLDKPPGVGGPSPQPPQTPQPPADAPEKDEVVLGARILGAGVGGFTGNKFLGGIQSSGLATCSPFNLDGCNRVTPEPPSYVPSSGASAMDEMDNPLANILRNPTSILPSSWKLEGRSYLEDAASPAPATTAPTPAPTPAVPEVPAMPTLPTTPVPSSPESLAPEEQVAILREQIMRLQQQQSITTSQAPPLGVPPASAAEYQDAAQLQLHGFAPPPTVAYEFGAHDVAVYAAAPQADHSLVETSAGFAAVADLGDVAGSAIGTLVFAALGALTFEYIATNKAAPIPDPMLSGFWSSIHGAVRFASLATGKAAKTVKGVLPF